MFPLTKVTFAVPEILACCTSIPGRIPTLEESIRVDALTGMLAEAVRVTAVWKNGSPGTADAELLAFVAMTDGVLKFAWLTWKFGWFSKPLTVPTTIRVVPASAANVVGKSACTDKEPVRAIKLIPAFQGWFTSSNTT